MEKVVYLLWGPAPGAPAAAGLAPSLVEAGARHVVAFDVDPHGDARYAGPGPIDRDLGPFVGVVTCWLDCIDDLGPIDLCVRADRPAHGYLVTESVPLRSRDVVPPGSATPGFTLLTVLDRPDRLGEAEFLHNWTVGHTPRTLRWAPLTAYVRNHVVRALTPAAPRLAGIVSEQVAVLDDMVDPVRFMGAGDDPDLARARAAEMAEDVDSFIDFARLEAHSAIERRFS